MKIFRVTGVLLIFDTCNGFKMKIDHGEEKKAIVHMTESQYKVARVQAREASIVSVTMKLDKDDKFWMESFVVVMKKSKVAERREQIWREEALELLKKIVRTKDTVSARNYLLDVLNKRKR